MPDSKVKLRHSFKTVFAYESISLKRDPVILAVVLLTPALMALVLHWLLFYILNANLIASEVALPVYLPLEKLNLSLERFRLGASYTAPFSSIILLLQRKRNVWLLRLLILFLPTTEAFWRGEASRIQQVSIPP